MGVRINWPILKRMRITQLSCEWTKIDGRKRGEEEIKKEIPNPFVDPSNTHIITVMQFKQKCIFKNKKSKKQEKKMETIAVEFIKSKQCFVRCAISMGYDGRSVLWHFDLSMKEKEIEPTHTHERTRALRREYVWISDKRNIIIIILIVRINTPSILTIYKHYLNLSEPWRFWNTATRFASNARKKFFVQFSTN